MTSPQADPGPAEPGHPPRRAAVLVTAYRPPVDLLAICLRSALDQTVADIEVLLVVDGELGDEAEDLVADVGATDDRLRVLRPGRVGRGAALNVGLEAAQAPVVAILDADDAAHPERIARSLRVLDHHPDVAMVAAGARVERTLDGDASWTIDDAAVPVRDLDRALLRSNPVIHSAVAFRTDAVKAVGGYDPHRVAQLDYDLWLRLRAEGQRIAMIDIPLALHRRHPNEAFEGMSPSTRAWGSYRLQASHLSPLPLPARLVHHGIAAARLGYQITRSSLWHLRSRIQHRSGTTPVPARR